jgi:hypothetical protein
MDLKRKPALEGMSSMNVAFLYIFIWQGYEKLCAEETTRLSAAANDCEVAKA